MSNVLLGQVPQYAVAADYSVSSPITTGSPVYADVAQSPNPSPANTSPIVRKTLPPIDKSVDAVEIKRGGTTDDKVVNLDEATKSDEDSDKNELKEGFKISAPVILLGAAAIYFFFFRKK